MKAKDKAKELVEKFKNRSIELGNTHSQLMAEANALIVVDEIINVVKRYETKKGRLLIDNINLLYWQEVKQEIEKL